MKKKLFEFGKKNNTETMSICDKILTGSVLLLFAGFLIYGLLFILMILT